MTLILDTDHLSILQQEDQPSYNRLRARLAEHPEEPIAVTIISFQEQIQGWMAYLNQARTASGIILAYEKLVGVLRYFSKATVIPFNQAAQVELERLRKQGVRIGTLDLRIASIALAERCVLVSGNLKDFRKVPGLNVEDWLN